MHIPVLLPAILNALQPHSSGIYLDGTLGAAGHAKAILTASNPDGLLIGLDQDLLALELARQNLSNFAGRTTLIHANFSQLTHLISLHRIPPIDGILFDLGVSSMQLDQPKRGFSFQKDGPLDMRMDTTTKQSAADLVNTLPETELANLIYQYGEERQSRRIAKAVINKRPFYNTLPLAKVIAQAKQSSKRTRIHPATKTFQALRIAVNDELGVLKQGLAQAIQALKPAGRLAVITFHSLEDRIVKHFFRREATDCLCPPEQLFCVCDHQASINLVTKKPIMASVDECSQNPRARSAKLRVVCRKVE